MFKVILSLIFLFLSINSLGKELFFHQELVQKELALNSQLNNSLKEYLGSIRFTSSVKVNSSKVDNNENDYALFMGESKSELNEYRIDSLEVRVVVFESIEGVLDEDIKRLTSSIFRDYQVNNVDLKYIESTRFYAHKLENSIEDGKSFIQGILSKNSVEIIRLLGIIVLSLFVLIGIVILAKVVSGPLRLIAESIRTMSLKTDDKLKSSDDSSEPPISDEVMLTKKTRFSNNIVLLKDLLIEHPEFLKRIMQKSDKSAHGVRKVLPYIYDQSIVDIIRLTVKNDIVGLEDENVFQDDVEFFDWLNEFVEDYSACTIEDKWTLLNKLSKPQLDKLRSIEDDVIIEFASFNNRPLVNQILLDYLKGESKNKLINSFDENAWSSISEVDAVSSSQVEEVVADIETFSMSKKGQGNFVCPDLITSNVILPSIVNMIPNKKVIEQDSFVASVIGDKPEFRKMIREHFFLPSDILLMSQNDLRESLLEYGVEKKVNILSVLPENVKDFMFAAMNGGKVKEIVKSRLESVSLDDIDESDAKLYLDNLYKKYKSNLISLNEDVTTNSKLSLLKSEQAA